MLIYDLFIIFFSFKPFSAPANTISLANAARPIPHFSLTNVAIKYTNLCIKRNDTHERPERVNQIRERPLIFAVQ